MSSLGAELLCGGVVSVLSALEIDAMCMDDESYRRLQGKRL